MLSSQKLRCFSIRRTSKRDKIKRFYTTPQDHQPICCPLVTDNAPSPTASAPSHFVATATSVARFKKVGRIVDLTTGT